MAKTKNKSPQGSPTGTYRYDREKGEVVQVSTDVPKVSSKGKSRSPELPCGRRSPCGGGSCPS